MSNTRTKKIAAYIRVSTAKQADEGYSPETQKASIQSYIKHQYPTFSEHEIDFFTDEKSASKTTTEDILSELGVLQGLSNRPGLRELIDGVALGKYKCVIVYTRDRLARNMGQYLALKRYFEKNKVDLHFSRVGENFNLKDEKYNRLLEVILASFAELESQTISTRVRSGCLTSIDKNSRPGARIPYGFEAKEFNGIKTLVPIAEQMKNIHRIYDLYVHKGLGYRKIANEMNKEFDTFIWNKSKVESILKNEIYTGKSSWGKRSEYPYARTDKHSMILRLPNNPTYLPEDLWLTSNTIRNMKTKVKEAHHFHSPFLLKDKLYYFVPELMEYKKMTTRNYGDGNFVYRVEKRAGLKEYYVLDRNLVDRAVVQQVRNLFTVSFKQQAMNLLNEKCLKKKRLFKEALQNYAQNKKELAEYKSSLEKLMKADFDYRIRDRIEEQLVYTKNEIKLLKNEEEETNRLLNKLDEWDNNIGHKMNQLENALSDLTSVAARMFIYLAIDSVKLSVVNELLNIKIHFNFTES